MKSLIQILTFLTITIFFFSCKKNNDVLVTAPAPVFDYSKVKLKSKIQVVDNNVSDTTRYTYTINGLSEINTYSNNTSVFKTDYARNGNMYNGQGFTNNTLSINWINHMNAVGYVDSSFGVRLNGTFNNKLYNKYDANGYNIEEISSYITYGTNRKKYYANGNISYMISDFWQTNPVVNRRDSIVLEKYTDKAMHVFFDYRLQEIYGKMQKNLTKKQYTYNTSNLNELTRIIEYDYETDANGLVKRETQRWYSQPGNTLIRTGVYVFEYTTE
jgi:hypothetical protein